MITAILFLTFCGCFFLFCTSKRALLNVNSRPEKWFVKNQKATRILGVTDLIAAILVSIVFFGAATGILIWMVMLFLLLSLLLLLYPLHILNYRHLITLVALLLICELVLF